MNYPNGIKKSVTNHHTNYANRGMMLEQDLNSTNIYYRQIEKILVK